MPASPIHVRVLFTDSHVGVGQSHLVLVEKYDIRGIAPGGHRARVCRYAGNGTKSLCSPTTWAETGS